jgi:hypothetical protein
MMDQASYDLNAYQDIYSSSTEFSRGSGVNVQLLSDFQKCTCFVAAHMDRLCGGQSYSYSVTELSN